jgi:DNA-binding CsgD family transcriptional regulator
VSGLTARQRQMLLLVAAGRTNTDIASRLAIRPGTVNDVLRLAYQTLGARDRAHAVALAIWYGDISPNQLATIAQPSHDQQQQAA